MTPIVPPSGPTPPSERFGRTLQPTAPEGTGFAKVFDLSVERAKRNRMTTPAIPQSVLDEMSAARRVLDALDAQGAELRFELEQDGRVRAELRSVDGTVVRQVPLTEAIDVGTDPTPAA